MLTEDKTEIVYIYILGSGNIYNGKNDAVSSLVPYKLNDNILFFGPCKRKIREEIKKHYLKEKDYINLDNKEHKIYIVGINPNISGKDEVRKLLFAGKIKIFFTFKKAWNHYNELAKKDIKINKMINGINEELYRCEHKKINNKNFYKNQDFKSPLHLIPIKKGKKKGYKHRISMHKYDWIKDILSQKELQIYKDQNNLSGKVENFTKKHNISEILKISDIKFQRDCCFSLENIFFSEKSNPNPIPLDEELLNLIKTGLTNPKGADLKYAFVSFLESISA